MSLPPIDVYIDYVCPFCLLAEDTITAVAAEHDSPVRRHPFELRPFPTPTLRPGDEYLPRIWQSAVYPMARRLGVAISLPRVSPQPYTHTAFEGYQFALEHHAETAYSTSVLRAFFQHDRDIGDIEVLTELASDIGLSRRDFSDALLTRRYAAAHQQALERANANAIHAVPTMIIGQRRIEGVPSREILAQALTLAAVAEPNTALSDSVESVGAVAGAALLDLDPGGCLRPLRVVGDP